MGRAFTLVEVALAIVIVGVGALAVLQLSTVCAFQNRAASDMTTAALLGEQIREMLADLPLNDPSAGSTNFGAEAGETIASFDDVDDFDGQTFSPVLDAGREEMSGFEGYSQAITVNPVAVRQLSGNTDGTTIAKTTYTGAVRVTISVRKTEPASETPKPLFMISFIRVEE